jgi:PAS domain-containing protein
MRKKKTLEERIEERKQEELEETRVIATKIIERAAGNLYMFLEACRGNHLYSPYNGISSNDTDFYRVYENGRFENMLRYVLSEIEQARIYERQQKEKQ